MIIRSKREFFLLWEAGVLGNRTRLWRDPEAAIKTVLNKAAHDFWKGGMKTITVPSDKPKFGFRELRKPGTAGAGKWELVPWHAVPETAKRWRAEGRDFIIDDGCPNELTTLCGEVSRTFLGFTGSVAIEPHCGMRDAINRALLLHRTPAVLRVLLDHYMDASSRDDLDDLLERYPDAAVEFSCFPRNVGVFPRRNTIFWEVRNY